MLVRVEHASAPDLCGNSVLLLRNTDKSRHDELAKVVNTRKQGIRDREADQESCWFYSFSDVQDTIQDKNILEIPTQT